MEPRLLACWLRALIKMQLWLRCAAHCLWDKLRCAFGHRQPVQGSTPTLPPP